MGAAEESGKAGDAGRDPAEEGVGAEPGQRSQERDLPPERPAEEDRVRAGGGDRAQRVAEGQAGGDGEAERRGGPLDSLAREPPEVTAGGDDRDRGARTEGGDGSVERDEVAAGRRRHGDDPRQALDVVRGRSVVPDEGARMGGRDG